MLNAEEVNRAGFSAFHSPPDETTISVAHRIGKPAHLSGFRIVQTLMPKAAQAAPPNTYSGIYGVNEFPFHSDLAHWSIPPRFLLLRCRRPSESAHTKLLKFDSILAQEPEEPLSLAHFRQRRRLEGRMSILKLKQGLIHRWDERFLVPYNEFARDLFTSVARRLSLSAPVSVALPIPGACLLIDNWRMLHGRTAIDPGEMDRCLERVYLEGLR